MPNTFVNHEAYPDACRHCRSTDVVVDDQRGDVVCRACGTVLRDRLEVDDAVLRLDAHGGDLTRVREKTGGRWHGDVDIEGLDRARAAKRGADEIEEDGWGGDGASLDQLHKAQEKDGAARRAAGEALDAFARRLTLPPAVKRRARGLVQSCSLASFDAAAAAARRRTASKDTAARRETDPSVAQGAAACAWAARLLAFPLSLKDIARAAPGDSLDAVRVGRALAALERRARTDGSADVDGGTVHADAAAFVPRLRARLAAAQPPDAAVARLVHFVAAGRDLRPEACAADVAARLAEAFPGSAQRAQERHAAAALFVVARDRGGGATPAALARLVELLASEVPSTDAAALDKVVAAADRAGVRAPPLDFLEPKQPSPDSVVTTYHDQPPENKRALELAEDAFEL